MMAVSVVSSMATAYYLAAMVVILFRAIQIAVMIMIVICTIRRAIVVMGSVCAVFITTSHAADKSGFNNSGCVRLVILLVVDL